MTETLRVEHPYSETAERVLELLSTDPRRGLTSKEAAGRQALIGANTLAAHAAAGPIDILLDQLRSPVVVLLIAAAALSVAFGDWIEAGAILAVLLVNTGIGFVTETRAERSMEALRQLASEHQRVRRDGEIVSLPAAELVPGDIVLLEEGDVATADARLIEVADLASDESALTGESVPITKSAAPVAASALLGDRTSMVYKGSAITRGAGLAAVTATGRATELGHIAALAASAAPEASPLTQKLRRLSRDLVALVLAITAAVGLAGILHGNEPLLMIKAAISLAVAAIPEGLPVVATMVLARGMLRMAERNAIIERLSAVETLGATTVILTDKTGTLTENRMTVRSIVTAAGDFAPAGLKSPATPDTVRLLKVAALCNTASLGNDTEAASGDPMERALLQAARLSGLERPALIAAHPETRRIAFDSAAKIMATIHNLGEGLLVAVKGAPEAVLERCTHAADGNGETPLSAHANNEWHKRVHSLAREGLRVLAIAERRLAEPSDEPLSDLTLLGLVALLDPPRPDVPDAIAACRAAGIKVVMVTGDHADTAAAVARLTGFGQGPIAVVEGRDLGDRLSEHPRRALEADVLARVTPRQKLELVEAYKRAGHVVAMTGDGVNDAPALKRADIGVAMGRRGTEVARQAAAMVLRDDAFPTIVDAIRQGRVIFGNIRRFVIYLLACNLSEVLVVSLAIVAGMPLPLQPIQILFMNMVTDVFPALALAMGEGDRNVLLRPPRHPGEPLVARRHWIRIGVFGLIITAFTLATMQIVLNWDGAERSLAATASFLTLALSQLLFVFNMIERSERLIDNAIVRNRYIWGATALCLVILYAGVSFGPFAHILKVRPPDAFCLMISLAMSLGALVTGALALRLLNSSSQTRQEGAGTRYIAR